MTSQGTAGGSPPRTAAPGRHRATRATRHAPTSADTAGKTLLSGTLWQALSLVLPLLVNLVLTPYVVKGLGPALYGIFLLTIMAQLVLATLDGGVGQGANRFFALALGRGDERAITDLLGSLLGLVVALSLVVYTSLWFAVPALVDFFPATRPDRPGAILLMRVLLGLVVLTQVRALFVQVLFVHGRFRLTGSAILVGHVLYAIGLVVTIQTGAELSGIAWTMVVQQGFATLVIVPVAMGHLRLREFRFVGVRRLTEFFGYSWKVQLSVTGEQLAAQADAFVVAKFAASQLTPFGLGSSFAQTLRSLLWSASTPILSLVGRTVGAEGPHQARTRIESVQRTWVLVVCGWIGVGAPAAYTGVTHWLDLSTDLPGVVAALFLVGYGFSLLAMVQTFWCLTMGRPGLPLRTQIAGFVVNVALTAVLVHPLGAVGSVAATLVAEATTSIVFVWLARRRLEAPLKAPWTEIPWLTLLMAITASLAVQALLTGRLGGRDVVPDGVVGLALCGAASAPVLVVYLLAAAGPSRVRTLVRDALARRRG